MKKHILIAAASLLMITGCKDTQKEERAAYQRDSLLTVIDERESSVNEFITSFNEVEDNLDSIRLKQHIIQINSSKTGDLNISQKTRINNEIKAINALMDENTLKLKRLNSKLNRSDKKNVQLEKTIKLLNGQLAQKYVELEELNTRLNSLNAQVAQLQTSVDTLFIQNMAQSQSINEKSAQLRTAYYIIARSKDLQEWNLIDKQGGLLGIGQTAKLSNNLDMNMFTKIDYLEVTTIPINSKGIKIITTHPTGSFSLDKTGRMVNSIMINDPEKFWSASKYLVISK